MTSMPPSPHPIPPLVLQFGYSPGLRGIGVCDLLQFGYFVPHHHGIGFERAAKPTGTTRFRQRHAGQRDPVEYGGRDRVLGAGFVHDGQRGAAGGRRQ